jgi:hypothetical protein
MQFNVKRWAHNLQIEGVHYIDHGHCRAIGLHLNKGYKIDDIQSMGLYLSDGIDTVQSHLGTVRVRSGMGVRRSIVLIR